MTKGVPSRRRTRSAIWCSARAALRYVPVHRRRDQADKEPRGFDIDITKYDAVLSGNIDGAIGDLPVILAKIATPKYADLSAACQFKKSVDAAWIMQKDAPFANEVKAALTKAKADGKFDEWAKSNILPKLGGVDPASVPACADY